MKGLLLVLLLSVISFAETIEDYYRLSERQRVVLHQAYLRGKCMDLGYTLAAIAWLESAAGNVRINTNFNRSTPTIDLGVFHLNSNSFLNRYYAENPNAKRNKYLDNILLNKVIVDDEFACEYAIKEIILWKNMGRSWADTVKSYNCGHKINRSRCENYYKNIHKKVKVLQKVYK